MCIICFLLSLLFLWNIWSFSLYELSGFFCILCALGKQSQFKKELNPSPKKEMVIYVMMEILVNAVVGIILQYRSVSNQQAAYLNITVLCQL